MSKIIKIFFLIFILKLYPNQFNKSQIAYGVELNQDIVKSHLDIIFNELIKNQEFSKNQIIILNNYSFLENYSYSNGNYFFEAKEKSGINLDIANSLLFWRMDISTDEAHYEFYISHAENNTQKFSYKFILENGSWELIMP
jgi:hypothetical protein|tara:strand:- start:2155 stop:2577 length:423 start_codon:yes stop_codon:yes gene_type:complete